MLHVCVSGATGRRAAQAAGRGVVASGNFALTAALMTRFSLTAAEYLDWFEILDYARPSKADAPTGTARELAERMGDVERPLAEVDPAEVAGEPGLRGGTINGVQVHSLRLPSCPPPSSAPSPMTPAKTRRSTPMARCWRRAR